jgi:hypothetical protein
MVDESRRGGPFPNGGRPCRAARRGWGGCDARHQSAPDLSFGRPSTATWRYQRRTTCDECCGPGACRRTGAERITTRPAGELTCHHLRSIDDPVLIDYSVRTSRGLAQTQTPMPPPASGLKVSAPSPIAHPSHCPIAFLWIGQYSSNSHETCCLMAETPQNRSCHRRHSRRQAERRH